MSRMYLRGFGLAAILAATLAGQAFAQNQQQSSVWDSFLASNGQDWRAAWSDAGDRVTELDGRSAVMPGSAVQVARRFINNNAALLSAQSLIDGLELEHDLQSIGSHHVRFRAKIGGYPVFNGDITVHVSDRNQVYLLQSKVPSAAAVARFGRMQASAAAVTAERAVQAARMADRMAVQYDKAGNPMAASGAAGPAQSAFGYYVTGQDTVPAHRVAIGSRLFFVDATSGTILQWYDLKQSANGTGKLFDPNPVNSLNNATLRDLNNTNHAAIQSAYSTQTLPDIKETGTGAARRFTLVGPYVQAVNLNLGALACGPDGTGLSAAPPSMPTSAFLFGRNDWRFEYTMIYKHIDRNRRYIQTLGFPTLLNGPIRVDAYAMTADNSFYCPSPSGAGYLAFGNGGVDDAEDADVVLHEYGHAIHDASGPGRYSGGGQTGAMGEGFGDYWSYNSKPLGAGGWGPCFAEWDAEGGCLRRVDRTKRFPADYVGQVHRDGEIWSRGLRDLRAKLGATKANKIILKSHFLIEAAPTFSKGLKALVKADEELNAGVNQNAICSVFVDRGISTPECGYWIQMTWNKLGADVDLHLRHPSGATNTTWNFPNDCAYYNMNPNWGDPASTEDNPRLYRDCVTSCTSEQITSELLKDVGVHKVLAHYYAPHGKGASTVKLEVYRGGRRVYTGQRVLTNSSTGPSTGQVWHAFSINVAATGQVSVDEVDQMMTAAQAAADGFKVRPKPNVGVVNSPIAALDLQ
jgi:hypothetical protein